ncbi:hypothetical protein DUI87_04617 [Hirundo rustica rustica]|uniref:Disrupted in renal carcinoma protein 2 n=1 Tax=Hirundo rustica rustica TaxID=333673 RepID=A0A3M0L132_HIRRU|nr:hypothetical protein DUI87_04617 [Hirundo rustica rustica]
MNAAPFLSTTWFSPDERATATAIAALLNSLGSAAAFLVGPLVVPPPNGTAHLVSHSNTQHIKDRIEAMLYAEFGMVSLIFSAALAYFPSRPPFPPSVAAASQRLSYRRSFCRLLSNFRFLMIALAYAIPLGVFSGWSGVLDLILTPIHVSQVDAGWIGFWSIVGGCVVGIAMARFADFIRGMLKFILLLLLSGATLASTWFTLTCLTTVTHLPLTTATLYTSCILLGIFLNSSVPIFFELFVETVYPVPEGISCGVVTFLSNVFMGVLLFFLTFYHTGPGLVSISSSCCYLLSSESKDRLPGVWSCIVMAELTSLFKNALTTYQGKFKIASRPISAGKKSVNPHVVEYLGPTILSNSLFPGYIWELKVPLMIQFPVVFIFAVLQKSPSSGG